jgi:hypothetical protein
LSTTAPPRLSLGPRFAQALTPALSLPAIIRVLPIFAKRTDYVGNRSSSKALQRPQEAICGIRPIHQPQAASMETRPTPCGHVGQLSIADDF